MNNGDRITSFEEFWPFYVGEHRSPINRFLHYIGTSSGLLIILYTAITNLSLEKQVRAYFGMKRLIVGMVQSQVLIILWIMDVFGFLNTPQFKQVPLQ